MDFFFENVHNIAIQETPVTSIIYFFREVSHLCYEDSNQADFCLIAFLMGVDIKIDNSPHLGLLPFYVIVIFVYLSSLPVAHLSDAPRRRLVVTGDSARIRDETTESSSWFFKVLSV